MTDKRTTPPPKATRKTTQERTIKVGNLARVEGEGSLYIAFEGNKLTTVQLKIFEPPRLFEALLQGRHFSEAPDITARICGICPVAYQMSAVHAMEGAFDFKPDKTVRALRRLLYCGEWIESHILHIIMLHAPDFVGVNNVAELATQHKEMVTSCLRLKKLGNTILTLLGGRSVHPINVKVTGFYRLPTTSELNPLLPELEWATTFLPTLIDWLTTFTYPDCHIEYQRVALHHPTEYAMNEGMIHSTAGLSISAEQFEQHFKEIQMPHSTAFHATDMGDTPYITGPLARFTLNYEQLPATIQQQALALDLDKPCHNPFRTILIRALEVSYAVTEATRLINEELHALAHPTSEIPHLDLVAQANLTRPETRSDHTEPYSGCAATEAPRGLLYHRYQIDHEGAILQANIIPPTSQNQRQIESDLTQIITRHDHGDDTQLQHLCEQAIRNHDPCISCATHFLDLTVDRQTDTPNTTSGKTTAKEMT